MTYLTLQPHALTTDACIGTRLADILVKVRSLTGQEHWVLLHLEVQGQQQKEFECRLFEYYYRAYDRYGIPLLTIALLADDNPGWRPHVYSAQVWDTEVLTFRFSTVKLLDYESQKEALALNDNVFGLVVLAHLAARQTRDDLSERLAQKFQLTRRLYERGLNREGILNLYKFIDWVITLPPPLDLQYHESIHQLEEERAVSYITTAERIGMQKGYQQGRQQGIQEGIQEGRQEGRQEGEYTLLLRLLQRKFHQIPEGYRQRIFQADAETLLIWGERLLEANTLDEVLN